METNEVFDKVKGLFVEDLGIDESKVTMEAKLEEDLEIDESFLKLESTTSSSRRSVVPVVSDGFPNLNILIIFFFS